MLGTGHVFCIARSRVQIPLKSWIFLRLLLRNCINCVHNCQDHSSLDKILLLISQERKTLRNRTGNSSSTWKSGITSLDHFFLNLIDMNTYFIATWPQHSKVDVNFKRFLFAASTESYWIPQCLDTIVLISTISKRPYSSGSSHRVHGKVRKHQRWWQKNLCRNGWKCWWSNRKYNRGHEDSWVSR